MNPRWSSLTVKMPLVILVVALIPLLVYGSLSYYNDRNNLYENQNRATLRTVELVAEQLEHHLQHYSENLSLAAEHLALLEMPVDEQEWRLLGLLHQLEGTVAMTLLDPDGQERVKVSMEQVYSTQDLASRAGEQYMSEATNGKAYIGDPEFGELGWFVSQISAPLFDPESGSLAAVLLGDLSLREVFAETVDVSIGQKGLLYLVDEAGKVIFHPDSSVISGRKSLSQRPSMLFQKQVGAIMTNLTGEEVQASGVPVEGTTWYLIGERPLSEIDAELAHDTNLLLVLLVALSVVITLTGLFFSRRTTRPLKALAHAATQVSSGNLEVSVPFKGTNEIATVSQEFNAMVASLREMTRRRELDAWNRIGLSQMDEAIRGKETVADIARAAIEMLARYIDAQVAALYLRTEEGHYRVLAGYAHQGEAAPAIKFLDGEGLVGQVGRDRRTLLINDVPENYLDVASGLGSAPSASLLILPLMAVNEVIGVMELGAFSPFTDQQRVLLEQASQILANSLNLATGQDQLREALVRSQQDSEELQTQQEELQSMNQDLEKQTETLQAQQEELRVTIETLEEQSRRLQASEEELQVSNEELEEKSESLRLQQQTLKRQNSDLVITRQKLVAQAKQLLDASRYKSEFLANMSHELRTPLNSLLILSQDLQNNRDGNLTEAQVESADVIYNSGKDLLQLINDILDLSKIEAGKMEVRESLFNMEDLQGNLVRSFRHMAAAEQLEFGVTIDDNVPETVKTDRSRVEQILRNLIGNAIKFTSQGKVAVRIAGGALKSQFGDPVDVPKGCFAILVEDTGIGIPEDKLNSIFEAFQQIDGSLSRQFSGTGLGLTISREMVDLLAGEIHVFSQLHKGSTFAVVLPADVGSAQKAKSQKRIDVAEEFDSLTADALPDQSATATPDETSSDDKPVAPSLAEIATIADDREALPGAGSAVLIVEDDLNFARILANECRKKGVSFLHAADGQKGLELAEEYRPAAILLDIHLPGKNGIHVLESLKESIELRHIPVHVISADDHAREVLSRGAVRFVRKPASYEELALIFNELDHVMGETPKCLLVVDEDKSQRNNIVRLIGNGDVKSVEAESGEQAYEKIKTGKVDCMILDLSLPDMSGFELLEKLESEGLKIPPVIIYTRRDLTAPEEETLFRYSSSIIIKGVRSPERLLDETSLFLHRVVSRMPTKKQKVIANLHDGEPNFVNRKVLLADDDMRNVFALGKVLEQHGLTIFKAANGKKALEVLKKEPEIDLVLMDVMMPEMDGLEATRKIRTQEKFRNLPIIALTAKAMPENRIACLEAGASDYLSKPVDIEHLLSLLRVWLYR